MSPEAVPKGETLKKYSRNLTKEAMDGKLDPVGTGGEGGREGGCDYRCLVLVVVRG